MTDPVLWTENLTNSFGALTANDRLSVTIEKGDIHGIIGPNGSGKTTFFNTVTGLYSPDSGQVIFDGTDITGWQSCGVAIHLCRFHRR